MTAGRRAVLDACVLVPMPLADTLLRLAEPPALYLPRWSRDIMEEVTRTLIDKFGLPEERARRREGVLRRHFGEAWVRGYRMLIPGMTNHPGDRHVLAAAVKCRAELIVTYNGRHFPESALKPWRIEARGPSAFLKDLYHLSPGLVIRRLREQAGNIGLRLPDLLARLHGAAPGFVALLCEQLDLALPPERGAATGDRMKTAQLDTGRPAPCPRCAGLTCILRRI
jgi:hypothetical protein